MVYNPTHDTYLVVWVDWRDGPYDRKVYGRLVAADGQVGDEVLIANTAWSSARAAYNSIDDEFLVVWSEGYAEPSHYEDIYGQRLSGDSLGLIGGVINIYVGANKQEQTAIAYNPAENEYLVIWRQGPVGLAADAVYGRRLAANGDLLGSAFAIEDGGNTIELADLAFDAASDQYLAVWEDHRQALPRIYGQFVAADGALVGDDFVLSDISSDQEHPRTVASGMSGGCVSIALMADADSSAPGADFDPPAGR